MKHDTARGSATRASMACNCSSPCESARQYPSVHAAERRPPSRDRSLLTTHMLVPFGPVCQLCESTDADSLKAIVQQQQDDALLDLVGLCRVWRVTQSSRGCALWLGVRALSSSPTPLARYRTCVQVWRRCSILGEVSVQCSRWLDDWTSRLIHAAIYYDHR